MLWYDGLSTILLNRLYRRRPGGRSPSVESARVVKKLGKNCGRAAAFLDDALCGPGREDLMWRGLVAFPKHKEDVPFDILDG